MSKEQNKPSAAPILVELLVGVALIILWVLFFINRTCVWDMVALIVWAVILVLAAVWLIRSERKLHQNAPGGQPE